MLPFLWRIFFKTVGELLHLLTLHHKLIFPGSLKNTIMFPEGRSYQTQYFAKIFPSPLALTLHVHFYRHLKKSFENVLWIVIAIKNATFSAPKIAPKNALKTTYFMLFLKNLTRNLEKKLVIMFVYMK